VVRKRHIHNGSNSSGEQVAHTQWGNSSGEQGSYIQRGNSRSEQGAHIRVQCGEFGG